MNGRSTNREKSTNTQVGRIKEKEFKEMQDREANLIIKGVKEYGEKEHTLHLASDFLRDMVRWQGKICQVWRVGKICNDRVRPVKVILSDVRDKHNLLNKKQLLRGSRFFLDEDLTIKQEEYKREELAKVRAARDEGKRVWLYKGKAVIAYFGPHSKTGQQAGSKVIATNSLAESRGARSSWANVVEDPILGLTCQYE
ncbi:uncharacterized protein LOC131064153 [Cryptomeria japonica]|uniref:uncharacterized protein LOC131064153 n=1 Tax=Cryptomeria japonica TaxID=3369 RepID=UPI0027DAB38C|nr:uncharacterized protein LOC131064153 [Cryptomeria japonica]